MPTASHPPPGSFYRGALRTVWYAFGQRRGPLAYGVVLRALASLCGAVAVAVVAWSVDAVRRQAMDGTSVVVASAVVVGSVLVQYLLWYAANYHAWVGTFLAVGRGRVDALRHVQSLPVGTVAGRGAGDVSAVLSADYEQVAVFVHNGLMNLVAGAVMPVATVMGLAVVDGPMAAAVAVSMVAAVPVFLLVNRAFARQALARADALADANGRIVEYVQGIATARSYNQIGSTLAWYRDAVATMRQVNEALAVRIAPLAYVSIGTAYLGVPLVVAATAYWLLGGHLDVFAAVVGLVAVLRVYAPLASIATEIEGLRLADAALRRIGRLRDLPPQAYPTLPVARPDGHDLSFDAVTFGYSVDLPVLTEISFTARTGATTALVGPSGAGKSTLLALAARFYDPDSGAVRLGDVDIRALTADQLFGLVSVVFQDVYLFAGSIRDNIVLARPDADDAAVIAAATAARCHDFIVALPDGYATRVGEGGLTLSGGERQRVSIARAILKDSPVILLDEPTAALDPLTERDVQDAVARLTEGRTVIVVAHRLSTIRTADQIIVLGNGRVVQSGRHDDLIVAGGLYAQLWAERERASRWRLTTEPRG